MIAARQQRSQHSGKALGVVVDAAQQRAQMARERHVVAGDCRDRTFGRLAIVVVGFVDDARGRHTVGQHGQLLREPHVERIERVDAQPLRLGQQRPIELRVPHHYRVRKAQRRLFVRMRAGCASSRSAQRGLDATAHLRSRFARERDRDDLLGLLHRREQREIALDQELRLARTRPAPAR